MSERARIGRIWQIFRGNLLERRAKKYEMYFHNRVNVTSTVSRKERSTKRARVRLFVAHRFSIRDFFRNRKRGCTFRTSSSPVALLLRNRNINRCACNAGRAFVFMFSREGQDDDDDDNGKANERFRARAARLYWRVRVYDARVVSIFNFRDATAFG